ncbi:hypothetical protein Barb6XT_02159 [Bacteroidales bacterium Barb6XT]|nr:hypothetical protein Barb6XT_02159 [Bacteroidales bacterium Barb6XT]
MSGGGDYAYDTRARIEAEAAVGYYFVKWTDARGDSVSAANPFPLTVRSDMALSAYFAINSYAVRLVAENGRIKAGGGIYTHGAMATAEAAADGEGYHFVKWTDAAGDSLSGDYAYRFLVTGETVLTAVYERENLTEPLTGSEQPPTGFETPLGVYYTEGVLHLVNLDGYFISVSTMKGERVLQFTADDGEYPVTLPAGIYILNAAGGKEGRFAAKFVVR